MHRRRSVLLSAVAALLVGAALLPTAAHAAYGYPLERPSGEHVVAATSTSFTVASTRAPHALSYRMYVASTAAGVYVANITSSTRQVASTSSTLTVTGLRYTSSPYYYRLKTVHGTSYRWGAIHSAGVAPATPTGLRVVSGDIGLYLLWNAQSAAGFIIVWATNPLMTENRVSRVLYGNRFQYTPEGLVKGRTYYFAVAGRNYTSRSHYSAHASAVAQTTPQSLRVLTYNILDASTAGLHPAGAEVYQSWAARRAGVTALLVQSKADVMGIEEAGQLVGGTTRQVDDLVARLPGFALARTETPPGQAGSVRTGVYIVYRTSMFRPYGSGGHWAIGDGRWAAYQVLQSVTTGAKFLFVSTHLIVGHSTTLDAQRARETSSLLSQAATVAGQYHVRVVYSGDFNSALGTTYATDGPGNVMRDQHITDGRLAALIRYNQMYNSANQYWRTPMQYGHSIDFVYTGPAIATRYWGVIANLSNGSFVGTIPSDHDPVWATITIPST